MTILEFFFIVNELMNKFHPYVVLCKKDISSGLQLKSRAALK